MKSEQPKQCCCTYELKSLFGIADKMKKYIVNYFKASSDISYIRYFRVTQTVLNFFKVNWLVLIQVNNNINMSKPSIVNLN